MHEKIDDELGAEMESISQVEFGKKVVLLSEQKIPKLLV